MSSVTSPQSRVVRTVHPHHKQQRAVKPKPRAIKPQGPHDPSSDVRIVAGSTQSALELGPEPAPEPTVTLLDAQSLGSNRYKSIQHLSNRLRSTDATKEPIYSILDNYPAGDYLVLDIRDGDSAIELMASVYWPALSKHAHWRDETMDKMDERIDFSDPANPKLIGVRKSGENDQIGWALRVLAYAAMEFNQDIGNGHVLVPKLKGTIKDAPYLMEGGDKNILYLPANYEVLINHALTYRTDPNQPLEHKDNLYCRERWNHCFKMHTPPEHATVIEKLPEPPVQLKPIPLPRLTPKVTLHTSPPKLVAPPPTQSNIPGKYKLVAPPAPSRPASYKLVAPPPAPPVAPAQTLPPEPDPIVTKPAPPVVQKKCCCAGSCGGCAPVRHQCRQQQQKQKQKVVSTTEVQQRVIRQPVIVEKAPEMAEFEIVIKNGQVLQSAASGAQSGSLSYNSSATTEQEKST